MLEPLHVDGLARHLEDRYGIEPAGVVALDLGVFRVDLRDGSRPRTRTFDLTTKSCALKYEGNDLLLRRMLAESGVDLTAGAVTPYARPS